MKLKFKLACLICVFAIPVILSSCKESIDVEEIASPNLIQGVKPSEKEIEDFKNWYSNLEDNPNARVEAKDEIYEIQEIELWKKAKVHKQDNPSNKLMTLPLIDFKEKGKTKVKQLYLTEIDGKKSGYKVEINSSNGKSDKFTGTVTITSLDEKSKREYKYKDNKLESKKNSRLADFDNVNLPEVTVSASVFHNGTWYFVQLQFNAMNPYVLYASVEPSDTSGGSSYSIDPEYDATLVEAMIDEIRDRLLREASKHLNPTEMAILRTMSTSNILKFYANIISARNWTGDKFGPHSDNDQNQHANAFKHTYLSALQTMSFGSNLSTQLMSAHEAGQSNACDTSMDMLNNEIGINIGSTFSGSNYDLVTLIYNMAKNGQLWTVGGSSCVHRVPF